MYSGIFAEQVLGWFEQFDKWLRDIAFQHGYVGIFIVSLIGAASIIVPIPYTIMIFFMGKILNPILIAISSGTGSAIGEFSGYVLGYYGRAVVSEDRKRKMNYVVKLFNRYGAFTVFVFALTPLPDDLLFIPLGIMRYSFIKAFIPCLIGKIIMSLILAYGGYMSIGFIENIFGEAGSLWTTVAEWIVLVVIVVVMLKVDWEKIFPLEERKDKSDRK